MAGSAIRRETRCRVIGVDSGLIIRAVTTEALVSKAVELHIRGRLVTLSAIHNLVNTSQWETILIVKVCDIIDHPIERGMATGTIIPHCLLVNINVTSIAIQFCGFRKHQCFVAGPAIHRSMSPF